MSFVGAKKSKNKISKIEKKSERMAHGVQQLKFERNPCIRYRDNCDTDERRTNLDFMISADKVKQS